MTENFKETIEKQISKLPTLAQNVIAGFDWVKITEETGKKFSLSESDVDKLLAEVLIVLVGVDYPDMLEINIEKNLKTETGVAQKISEELFERIFIPIGTAIEENVKKNMHGKEMTWKQSVDFILSGGDYSILLEASNHRVYEEPPQVDHVLGAKSMQDMKDRLVN